ncbi:cell division protein FtsB [Oleiphilus sp. HI0009]|jgi:cell division protein FtsB|uniref:septum formation initiator family protein n=1 Tax=unclassified Oleiphilus TaxID=2631174 RepID=UPI0007C22953|nr:MULTISPECIES: septum formation initiator family protein [unclassified Oleiphilus]KZX71819.1 cell division protein FtsB [Oleiphilus sp. HI0009]MCH2157960.1 septum formation initiator family protein [Oleiphilaceae bacterium]KZX77990.1 cell division protein FtsB [Oleiphilus sp. HI0009]KZY61821.1 cell division protein FtsB [Oleiphilus sp. HI0066]KZY69972.1 cell division protein FtsB [Oleiphilus sp. HI0067]
MKLLWGFLLLATVVLQFRLWAGEGGIFEVWQLQEKVDVLRVANLELEERNGRLDAKVTNLKKGYEVIEERARVDLGMIGRNETFFMVVNSSDH